MKASGIICCAVLFLLLAGCGPFESGAPLPSAEAAAEPSLGPSEQPSPTSSPSLTPPVTPPDNPMITKNFDGLTLQVRQSWIESSMEEGVYAFVLDQNCMLLLQQIAVDETVSDEEVVSGVMEALAPGQTYTPVTVSGFNGKMCTYVSPSDEDGVLGISASFVHGRTLSTLTLLMAGGTPETVQEQFRPFLESMGLTAAP